MLTIPANTIVSGYTTKSDWFGTNYNMNIYKGCCHGCIYCDSRSECYHIENFDTVRAKENALQIIRSELSRKVKPGVVGMGSMSDPYNPFEKDELLTRHTLELISAYGFGVAIATKSPLVTRDIDILSEIAERNPVIVKITITTPRDDLSRKIERNVAVSSERFAAIKKLSDAGIFCGILMMPILPFIEDGAEDITELVKKAAESGARFIYGAFGVTLRQNQRDYFFDRLDEDFPGMKERYIYRFGNSYSCSSPDAKRLWGIFSSECAKYGILCNMRDIISAYKLGYDGGQLSFF